MLVPHMALESPESLPSSIPMPKMEKCDEVIRDERVPGSAIISINASEYMVNCLRIILSIR